MPYFIQDLDSPKGQVSHSVLNWAQAKANLWKILTTGWVRNPSSLSSQEVLVSSLYGCSGKDDLLPSLAMRPK